jgi:Nif-specific ferredoxin III
MSEVVMYKTFGGSPWTPMYVETFAKDKCLGCGRCVKLCAQKCLGIETYEDDEGTERQIARIAVKDNCIGCQSCGNICVRKCYTFKEKSA